MNGHDRNRGRADYSRRHAWAWCVLDGTNTGGGGGGTPAGHTPTNTIRISGAGTAGVNQDYHKVNDNQFNSADGNYTLIHFTNTEVNTWWLYNLFAVAIYSCPIASFPFGPWIPQQADAPGPTGIYV